MRCGSRLPGHTPDLLKVYHVLAKLPSLPDEHEHRIRTLLYIRHTNRCARLHSTGWFSDAGPQVLCGYKAYAQESSSDAAVDDLYATEHQDRSSGKSLQNPVMLFGKDNVAASPPAEQEHLSLSCLSP